MSTHPAQTRIHIYMYIYIYLYICIPMYIQVLPLTQHNHPHITQGFGSLPSCLGEENNYGITRNMVLGETPRATWARQVKTARETTSLYLTWPHISCHHLTSRDITWYYLKLLTWRGEENDYGTSLFCPLKPPQGTWRRQVGGRYEWPSRITWHCLTLLDITWHSLILLDIAWQCLTIFYIAYLAGGGGWLLNYGTLLNRLNIWYYRV